MIIHILFAQRKCDYPFQYAPEAWAAADEHTMDENPEYMQNEVKKLKSAGDLYENHAIVRVSVPDSDIDRALRPTATGKVLGG